MIQSIAQTQLQFFNTNETKNVDFRITQLRKLLKVLQENEDLLMEAIYKDFKKSPFDTYTTELALVYAELNLAIRKVKRWSRKRHAKTNIINQPGRSYRIPEPLGVSLVIGSWNYPYYMSLGPVIPAIAAGNTVVLKPSEMPKHTSEAIAQLINQNFDKSYFHVIEGGIPETTELLNQKFDKIFFTGSTSVGKIVYAAAAKNLTPVTLELGGKSPVFFTESASLDVGIKRLVWAKYLNSGQTCIAPDYVFVHSKIKEKFIQKVKAEIEKSDFSVENENYVQIINDRNVDRLSRLIDKEKVIQGGDIDRPNRTISPTVMDGVSFDDAIMQEEIFGPLMALIEYDDLDWAINEVKKRPKPLACYVYSTDKKVKKKILHELSFGGGGINESVMHITNPHFGYGGVGESGLGSYHGKHGFDDFSHHKSIIEKPAWFELNFKYYKRTAAKYAFLRKLMNL